MIPAYVAAAVLLAGLYHVFLSRKVHFVRAATAVLVLAVVLGAAGKGTFGKLIAGPDDGTWETLRSVIPAKTDYDMVLSLGHWKDGRQVQYYLDGVAAHWETRMFVELLEPPEDWQSERDEVVGGQPVTFDGRWWVNAEAPLFDPGAWEDADARLENLTDKTVVLILLSDDSVEKKLERLLSERRVLVMLVEDSELGQQYRPLLERLAWPLGRTKELSLHLSGLCND